MKINQSSNHQEQGSTLLVALIISAIMGITLASFLIMTQRQNVSVARSQTWNAAMALTEAGVEDGLAMINKTSDGFNNLNAWVNSATSDGYTVSNSMYYVRRYVNSDSWGTNYYDVFINNADPNSPVVSATGYVNWKYFASAAPSSYYAAVGVGSPLPQSTSRKINVKTRKDGLFTVAMAAIFQIELKGFNVSSDSFDSGDPNYSIWNGTYGVYPVGLTNKTKATGDIVTDYTIVNALSAGNAHVKGKLKTGPNGTIDIGPNGSVGDKAWVEGGSTGIKPGWSSDDMNVKFPSVTLPTTTWSPIGGPSATINGITYDYVITSSGDYRLNGLTKKLYIGPNVVCRINCVNDVSLTGSQDEIRVAMGAKVQFYMNSANCTIKGNGVVNDNNQAINFQFYGTPLNTSLTYGGNGTFIGVIYAPDAIFTLGGGGSDVKDFIGSSVTKTVKMNGGFNFHYDENLNKIGPARGFIPTDWKEM